MAFIRLLRSIRSLDWSGEDFEGHTGWDWVRRALYLLRHPPDRAVIELPPLKFPDPFYDFWEDYREQMDEAFGIKPFIEKKPAENKSRKPLDNEI